MSEIVQPPSCNSGFEWMDNSESQGPCTVAAWLFPICQNSSTTVPGNLGPPLSAASSSYSAPNASANTTSPCSCSWAFYNTIAACTVCQGFAPTQWTSWSSECDSVGLTSETYWPSHFSFSRVTELPQWSIFDPQSWDGQTFNQAQAEDIADQNLPDATDSSTSQPTVDPEPSGNGSGKSNVGAIAGGVVGGVLGLAILGFILWYVLYRRHLGTSSRGQRGHIDLNDGGGGEPLRGPSLEGSPHASTSNADAAGTHRPAMHQMQSSQSSMLLGYPVIQPTQVTGPAPVITRTQALGGSSSRGVVPATEWVDEKQRLRAERMNGRPSTGPMAYPRSESGTSHGNTTIAISHSQSQLFANVGGSVTPSRTDSEPQLSSGGQPSRRNSIIKVPWQRPRMVMNGSSSDAGSEPAHSPRSMSTPLPGSTAPANAATGRANPISDLIALVPGARRPTARERENPPPTYVEPSRPFSVGDDRPDGQR
ncbi:hypothetical protein M0805_009773 [Coniferiporia weirii]|nr:hypothetical protein M0805_009773 [Coniferiporia weirii]